LKFTAVNATAVLVCPANSCPEGQGEAKTNEVNEVKEVKELKSTRHPNSRPLVVGSAAILAASKTPHAVCTIDHKNPHDLKNPKSASAVRTTFK
jgi:hypothetical protein